MLIYQPIEEIISVLYHCTLTTNKHHSSDESHDQSKLITSNLPRQIKTAQCHSHKH